MPQQNIDIVIKAQDEASKAFEGISDKVKGLGVAFTAVGAVITTGMGFAIKAASDAQVQMQGVDTILSAMKDSSKTAADGLKNHSDEMKLSSLKAQELRQKITDLEQSHHLSRISVDEHSKSIDEARVKMAQYQGQLQKLVEKQGENSNALKLANSNWADYREQIVKAGKAALDLGFDDEATSLSITKLFQRTGDLTKAIELNHLAMDLARSKHIDLATAGNLVGLVMSGNARVLKQYGIDIKDTATPTEALSELQVKLKGTAEDYAKTFAGQSDVLKEKVSNIVEAIGGKLLPILTRLAEHIAPIADQIVVWMDHHEKLTQVIVVGIAALGVLLSVLGPLLLILPTLVTGIQLVGAALLFLSANPIVLIIAAIVALIAVIVLMITHWQKTKEIALQVWTDIKAMVGGAMETVKNYLGAGMDYVKTMWNEAWLSVKTTVMDIWNGIVSAINGFIDSIVSKINSLKSSISSIGSSIGSGFSSAYNSVSSFVSGKRASGGFVSSGHPYLVGEQGPEVFTPNQSGYISPGAGLGLRPVVVYVTGNNISSAMDLNYIADQVGRAIVNKLRLNQKMDI